jgi:hypothetical protein
MSFTYPMPVPSTPADAAAALDDDLPVVLKGASLDDVEWMRPDPLTLVVPLIGGRPGTAGQLYFLKLNFGYYRAWPPSALFVNPMSLQYDKTKDKIWLPNISGCQEIAVHPDYQEKGQLICCSSTLEFYMVGHGVEAKHMWDPKSQNFAATINAIRRALRSDFYKGRQT